MFKSIQLKNFKCYKDSGVIQLRPLNIIIGANNSGKSTLLQSILALKQTAIDPAKKTALVTSGMVDLGGFHEILHRQSDASHNSFTISLATDKLIPSPAHVPPQFPEAAAVNIADQLDVSFILSKPAKLIRVEQCVLWSEKKKLLATYDGGANWVSDIFPQVPPDNMSIGFANFFPTITFNPKAIAKPLSREFITVFFQMQSQQIAWTELFRHVHRVAPLRSRVPWYSELGKQTSSEFGAGGENLIAALGNEEKIPSTGNSLVEMIGRWMTDKLKILKRIYVKSPTKGSPIRSLLGEEIGGHNDINLAAMGEGVSQILPIIAKCLASDKGECLLIEQPEIHLHPRLQADLADLFIEMATQEDRQVLVETHSEHLLLRIRRRIAQKRPTITPDKVAVIFVEKKNGVSSIRQLDLNTKGHFNEWPEGFFDDAYQEAMAIALGDSE